MSKNHIHFFFGFILECILGYTLESSIHIEPFFCRGLKVWYVSLRSTPCLCFLLRNLQSNIKNNTNIISMKRCKDPTSWGKKWRTSNEEKKTYHPTIPTINIYFVPQHNKWKVFRIRWTSLNIKPTKENTKSTFHVCI